MKATLKNVDTRRLRAAFDGEVSEFIRDNSDVGYYYSPAIDRGTRTFASCDDREIHTVPLLRVEFPRSTLQVIGSTIIVEGFRGSIEDCFAPILRAAGIDLDDRRWVIETTRPDAQPWYERAALAD